eukprot:gene8508-11500_t
MVIKAFLLILLCGQLLAKGKQTDNNNNEKLIHIQDRLKQIAQSSNGCSKNNWGATFAELHKNRLQSNNQRILVAVPNHSGFADRIIGFTTLFIASLVTERAFQIADRKELPLLETAFFINNIDWRRPLDPDWLLEPLRFQAKVEGYNETVLKNKEYLSINIIDKGGYVDHLMNFDKLKGLIPNDVKTVLILNNRGRTILMSHFPTIRQMGLTPENTFGCLFNYLMKPKPEIFLPVYNEFTKMVGKSDSETYKPYRIMIQIRVGDEQWTNKDYSIELNDYVAYFNCAQHIENSVISQTAKDGNTNNSTNPPVVWYLLTESLTLRKLAAEKFGSKIVSSTNVVLEHSGKEFKGDCKGDNCAVSSVGFSTAVAEWWLGAFADSFIVSHRSGYGKSSAMRSMHGNSIYVINKGKEHGRCHKSHIGNIATSWSGM